MPFGLVIYWCAFRIFDTSCSEVPSQCGVSRGLYNPLRPLGPFQWSQLLLTEVDCVSYFII